MTPELHRRLFAALERAHYLGMIGGELEEQLAHSASFSSLVADVFGSNGPARAVDMGTGGGVPGVVLAALWPDCSWTLIDVRAGRIAEVERAVFDLGISVALSTAAVQDLAHEPGERERFDLAVARSFGPASMTAECAAGLLRPGGVCIVSEPPTTTSERWHDGSLRALGFAGEPEITQTGSHRFAILRKAEPAPGRVPRRPARKSRAWYRSAGD